MPCHSSNLETFSRLSVSLSVIYLVSFSLKEFSIFPQCICQVLGFLVLLLLWRLLLSHENHSCFSKPFVSSEDLAPGINYFDSHITDWYLPVVCHGKTHAIHHSMCLSNSSSTPLLFLQQNHFICWGHLLKHPSLSLHPWYFVHSMWHDPQWLHVAKSCEYFPLIPTLECIYTVDQLPTPSNIFFTW